MPRTRERQLVETFVTLTDTLVAEYDVVDLLQSLVDNAAEMFDASAAGIMLADRQHHLEVIASTSERSNFLGLMQLEVGEGPCVEAFTTAESVSVESPAEMQQRWPRFAARSVKLGYAAVHSVPLRLRDTTLGSLNLFRETTGALNDGTRSRCGRSPTWRRSASCSNARPCTPTWSRRSCSTHWTAA